MKNAILGLCVAAGAVLVSCETGPSGPHPAHEAVVPLFVSAGQPVSFQKIGATLTYSVDLPNNRMITVRTSGEVPFNPTGSTEYRLYSERIDKDPSDNGDSRKLAATVELDLPSPVTGPTSFELKTPEFKGTFPFLSASDPIMTAAVVTTDSEGKTSTEVYYPISGKVTISEFTVLPTGGFRVRGWVTGEFKSIFPINFSLSSGIPEGFDPANPKPIGDVLRVHSMTFQYETPAVIQNVQ